VVESAEQRGVVQVAADLAERRADHSTLDHVRRRAPRLVVDVRAVVGAVVMFDRAAPRRLLHELDQLQLAQDLDVVRDVGEWDVELAGQFLRAGFALLEYRQHPGAQWMGERLYERRVLEFLIERHGVVFPNPLR
jgi:hypothetical protein